MIQCNIKGCEECASETFTEVSVLKHWVRFRACRCGAYDIANPKTCSCHAEGPIPTTYWPNLDWYALGGVDELVLCPIHKLEILEEIIRQRALDPSMNPTRQNRGNLH